MWLKIVCDPEQQPSWLIKLLLMCSVLVNATLRVISPSLVSNDECGCLGNLYIFFERVLLPNGFTFLWKVQTIMIRKKKKHTYQVIHLSTLTILFAFIWLTEVAQVQFAQGFGGEGKLSSGNFKADLVICCRLTGNSGMDRFS